MHDALMDAPALLGAAADRLEALARRSTPGDWRSGGLLATRPEVIARSPDGATQHVAEARASSAAWIAALSPAVAAPLAAWLRLAAADAATRPDRVPAPALELASVLVNRLP